MLSLGKIPVFWRKSWDSSRTVWPLKMKAVCFFKMMDSVIPIV